METTTEGVQKENDDGMIKTTSEVLQEKNDDDEKVRWTDEYARELHKPVRFKFKRRRVFSPAPDAIWAADLADMSKFSRKNKGYKFLLMVIDVFSKYAFVKPMKNKTGLETTRCFREIFVESKRSPTHIWVDKGKEFWNKNVENLLKEYNINLYSTENDLKSCVVERFIRSYKSVMYRFFSANRTRKYVSELDEMTDMYNSRKHRSIKCTPKQAIKPENFQKVFNNLYPKEKKDVTQPFSIGDNVRIARKKGIFEKGFTPNFSEEIFKVKSIQPTNPITYRINDMNAEKVKGTFYRQNLLKTNQNIYFIERILARREKDGVKQVQVRWNGYPKTFDQWIDDDEVIDTKEDRENDHLNSINTSTERDRTGV